MRPKTFHVELDNLKKILEIFQTYAEELYKVQTPSPAIEKEIATVHAVINIIQDQYLHDENFGMATVTLDEEIWSLIRGLCLRYIRDKRSTLEIEKSTERITGSTEQQERELLKLENLINFQPQEEGKETVGTIKPRDPLLKNFLGTFPMNTDVAEKTSIQLQVGDVYGQMIVSANNSGTINQSAVPAELVEALDKLSQEVHNSPALTPEQKTDALGDIQGIQAQITKSKPDKSILKTLLGSLSFLADSVQVGTAAVAIAPHLEKLKHLVDALPF